MTRVIHLKGLNGIRAIAALFVLLAHITLSFTHFGLNAHLFGSYADGSPRTLDMAGYGVSMFFSLSGFLITFLLLKEKEQSRINISKFYMRRILRIWPLYYTYFFLVVACLLFFQLPFQQNTLLYYLFFGANIPFILGIHTPLLVHFWSLGVEEQFYLFWPWLGRLSRRTLFLSCLFICVLLISLKIYLHVFKAGSILEQIIHVNRFHCMLFGALAALLYYQQQKLFLYLATHKLTQLIAWLCLLLAMVNRFHVASFLDNELISGITVLLILGQITSKGLLKLENRVLDFLGKISYGLYVIHPLVIYLFIRFYPRQFIQGRVLDYVILYSSICLVSVFLSHLSFEYLEKPFLKLKQRRFSIVKSRGTKEEQ
jgi:peptidoglycan/LPS O-acetylase OafA/YrhL